MAKDPTKKILLNASDGPEGIEIYTSEDRAVVDWAAHSPALYVQVNINGAMTHMGPFALDSIRTQVEEAVNPNPAPDPETGGAFLRWLRRLIGARTVVVKMCQFCDRCPKCKGDGSTVHWVDDGASFDGTYIRSMCKECQGRGLVKSGIESKARKIAEEELSGI